MDTITVPTVLALRGTGADTIVRITVHSGVLTGTAGATVRGDITATMILGITTHGIMADFTEVGTTRGTMEDFTEDIGDGMTHGIITTTMSVGMTRTIIMARHISEEVCITKTDITD